MDDSSLKIPFVDLAGSERVNVLYITPLQSRPAPLKLGHI